ncbi:aldo/keto reductase [Dorea sp. D27]|uniref:aldo/keto reductase n=1 Tax=Dorea sp. D27 TaxID=658665 RepID=UPI00067380FB|nr:aldo/keto reductase [Dorea sp. D27]KMZ55317.1 oxidoreductase, aldo/keto reductase family [Dorea sp. D27]
MNSIYDCYELNNGVRIPCIGFGTYRAADGEDGAVVKTAIEAGYRYFDTASFYGNERQIGKAIAMSQIAREEYFLTSKAWKTEMGYENIRNAFMESLERLETDYLDLYLIHWPLPEDGFAEWRQLDIESWRALEELYHEGKVRAVGVSNFLPYHIENLLKNCEVKPAVNQIEFHPGYTQEVTVRYCQEHDILVQAWSPMGRSKVLEEPVILKMAGRYGVTAAQICLRYALQRRVVPLPKSSTMERMKQNQDIFGFELGEEDMYILGTMPQAGWSGQHPEKFGR